MKRERPDFVKYVLSCKEFKYRYDLEEYCTELENENKELLARIDYMKKNEVDSESGEPINLLNKVLEILSDKLSKAIFKGYGVLYSADELIRSAKEQAKEELKKGE